MSRKWGRRQQSKLLKYSMRRGDRPSATPPRPPRVKTYGDTATIVGFCCLLILRYTSVVACLINFRIAVIELAYASLRLSAEMAWWLRYEAHYLMPKPSNSDPLVA